VVVGACEGAVEMQVRLRSVIYSLQFTCE